MLRILLALTLSALFMLPASAQTRAPTPNTAPSNTPAPNTGINFGGFIGRVVTEVVRQSAQDAINRANETPSQQQTPDPAPQSAEPAPAKTSQTTATPKKRTEYREVALPVARPSQFGGRPVSFDAPYDPQSLIVVYRPGPDTAHTLTQRYGLELLEERALALGTLIIARYRIPEGMTVKDLVMALKGDPAIVSVQPHYIYRISQSGAAPADMRALQYAPARLNALIAREAGDGAGITIGLIDTGVDRTQPVLAEAGIESFDVMDGVPVSNRDHGTALAGLMVAGSGLDGIAPGARVVSVRAFDSGADGSVISGSYEIAAGIDIAVENGADVLNLSFAGPRDPLVMSMLDAAAEQGVILVAAAGNGGPEAAPAYPGAHRSAIAVTATDARDAVFAGANRGYYIAVAAPGVDVLSPLPEGRFELQSGTSVATAHVSALVALMLEQNANLTRDAVVEILERSAHDLGAAGHDESYGAGLADAAAAVAAVDPG